VLPSFERLLEISKTEHILHEKLKVLKEAIENEEESTEFIAFLYIWISFELFKIEN
jgi:hypothetical protein